jgi:hypothetical protein
MEEIKIINNKAFKLLNKISYTCDCDSCDCDCDSSTHGEGGTETGTCGESVTWSKGIW